MILVMTNNILSALTAYLAACNEYADFPDIAPDPRPLVAATIALNAAIKLPHDHPEFSNVFNLQTNIERVASAFVFDSYSDDDTDAPCDIESDVHHLCHLLDPSHVIPEDAQAGHVIETVYPCICCDD